MRFVNAPLSSVLWGTLANTLFASTTETHICRLPRVLRFAAEQLAFSVRGQDEYKVLVRLKERLNDPTPSSCAEDLHSKIRTSAPIKNPPAYAGGEINKF